MLKNLVRSFGAVSLVRAGLSLGILFAVSGSASATTHQILQAGLQFVPNDLTVEVGDTVEWVLGAGSHTVTEGTDDANPPIGSKLFDESLNAGNPLVSFTFTVDHVGDVPYYCRLHLGFGMVGIIRVEASSTAAPEGVGESSFAGVKGLYR